MPRPDQPNPSEPRASEPHRAEPDPTAPNQTSPSQTRPDLDSPHLAAPTTPYLAEPLPSMADPASPSQPFTARIQRPTTSPVPAAARISPISDGHLFIAGEPLPPVERVLEKPHCVLAVGAASYRYDAFDAGSRLAVHVDIEALYDLLLSSVQRCLPCTSGITKWNIPTPETSVNHKSLHFGHKF